MQDKYDEWTYQDWIIDHYLGDKPERPCHQETDFVCHQCGMGTMN